MARKQTTGAANPEAGATTVPVTGELTPEAFIQRWNGRELSERAAAQSHFTDLCRMLGVPAPTDDRSRDAEYGFEARTDISASGVYATRNEEGQLFYQVETGTGGGFADVWKRDHFAWEYKRAGKHKDLAAALGQLRIYAPSLGNPPLLVVCDIDRFEIHTNFTGYPSTTYAFHITELIAPSASKTLAGQVRRPIIYVANSSFSPSSSSWPPRRSRSHERPSIRPQWTRSAPSQPITSANGSHHSVDGWSTQRASKRINASPSFCWRIGES